MNYNTPGMISPAQVRKFIWLGSTGFQIILLGLLLHLRNQGEQPLPLSPQVTTILFGISLTLFLLGHFVLRKYEAKKQVKLETGLLKDSQQENKDTFYHLGMASFEACSLVAFIGGYLGAELYIVAPLFLFGIVSAFRSTPS